MSQRTARVDELLRQEIGALLAKEVADPRIGFATITDVDTSPDLRHARVWVSVIGDPADRAETVRALQGSMGFIRRELGRRLRIKRIPELQVQLDDSAARGTRVLHLIQELEAGADPEAIAPLDDSLPTPVRRLPHEGDASEEPASDEEPASAAEAHADAAGADGSAGRSGRRPTPRRGPGASRSGRGKPPVVERRAPRRTSGRERR